MKISAINKFSHQGIFKILALSLIAFSTTGCIEATPQSEGNVELAWNELFELRDGNPPTLYALKPFVVNGNCPILPAHFGVAEGKQLNRDFIASKINASMRWAFDDNPVKGWTFTARYSETHNRYDIITCQ